MPELVSIEFKSELTFRFLILQIPSYSSAMYRMSDCGGEGAVYRRVGRMAVN
jgi:hypothetical protein